MWVDTMFPMPMDKNSPELTSALATVDLSDTYLDYQVELSYLASRHPFRSVTHYKYIVYSVGDKKKLLLK